MLIGMMGAGKTSVGTRVAAALGWRWWDNDVELLRDTGRDARTLVAEAGVDAAHAEETRVLLEGLCLERVVVSAAGSVVLDAAATAALRGEWVVWLRARVDTLAARVRRGAHRPFMEADAALTLQELDAQRHGLYEQAATLVVDVDEVTPGQAAALIVAGWRSRVG